MLAAIPARLRSPAAARRPSAGVRCSPARVRRWRCSARRRRRTLQRARGTSWHADEVDGVPASLDPSRWQIDAKQFKEYDRSRAVLFDTRVGSYLPARARYIQAALHREGDPRHLRRRDAHAPAAPPDAVRAGARRERPRRQAARDRPRDVLPPAPAGARRVRLGGGADGGGSFSELKKRVKWRKTWGYDINQYAKIFSYARQNGIRLVGLNVPYGMVQMVSNFGCGSCPTSSAGARAHLSARTFSRRAILRRSPTHVLSQVPARDGPHEREALRTLRARDALLRCPFHHRRRRRRRRRRGPGGDDEGPAV